MLITEAPPDDSARLCRSLYGVTSPMLDGQQPLQWNEASPTQRMGCDPQCRSTKARVVSSFPISHYQYCTRTDFSSQTGFGIPEDVGKISSWLTLGSVLPGPTAKSRVTDLWSGRNYVAIAIAIAVYRPGMHVWVGPIRLSALRIYRSNILIYIIRINSNRIRTKKKPRAVNPGFW